MPVLLKQGDMEAMGMFFFKGIPEGGGSAAFSAIAEGGTATKVLGIVYRAGSSTVVGHGAHAPLEINPSVNGVLLQHTLTPPSLGKPGEQVELRFFEGEGVSESGKVWLAVLPLDGTLVLAGHPLGGFGESENWFETRGAHYAAAPVTVPTAYQSKGSRVGPGPLPCLI